LNSIDPNFDKSYIRIIFSAIQLNNLDLANSTAEEFKNKFAQTTVNNHKEHLILLEQANNKAKAEKEEKIRAAKEKAAANAKAGANASASNANGTSTTASIPLKESNNCNNSQQSNDTTSASNPNNSVSKTSKRRWFNWVFGPALLISAASGLFFLLKNKNKFRY
jgi:hypothetical protein